MAGEKPPPAWLVLKSGRGIVARFTTRKAAMNYCDKRSNGIGGWCAVLHARTKERWERIRGAWFVIDRGQGSRPP